MIKRLDPQFTRVAKRDNHAMLKNIKPDQARPLLGGLSADSFMRQHWQKKPLLIRQAVPDASAVLNRTALFDMASQDGVESRLIKHAATGWKLSHGPFTRRQLPSLKTPAWTLLVQGVDLHCPAAHALLQQFRFVPEARLDDLMVSYASDQGGVGPHFDSYDVFLLQLHGRRRWRIGRLQNPELQANVPLRILANFEFEQEWVLEPGDMLYLPPRWAHDGQAVGECMTASIGFRSASKAEFAREVIKRSLDALEDDEPGLPAAEHTALYRDPFQGATATPGAIPTQMQDFARAAVAEFLAEANGLHCSLGEWLSEPKPSVWFEDGGTIRRNQPLSLDARSRMLYDRSHIYINGESYRAGGADARLLRCLADRRVLTVSQVQKLSAQAWDLVKEWAQAGWLNQSQSVDSGDET
jgi:50S ribosomal protein L16 3-hydroxylase